MLVMTTLVLSGLVPAIENPAGEPGGFRLPPPSDGHLVQSLGSLRVAPAAFQDGDSTASSQADETANINPGRLGSSASDDEIASLKSGSSEVPIFGAEGSMRWTIHGGYGIDVHGTNQEVQGGVGLQYFIVDGFAFAPEVNLWGFFQTGDDAFGGSLDLMFEWHFIRQPTWSLYGDFGIGLLGTTANVPYNGSEFNFTPQAGVGVTFDIGNNNRWYAGVRWHHISNASLYEDNPGRDSILIYTGINFPF
ncbi:MAG: acyloxyacyl hydrolase [Planctomycetota bacterium]|nr:acyloxyacyl hydrolase [Planctomycetota bacterium]